MMPWRAWQKGVGWVGRHANAVLLMGLLGALAMALVLKGTWMGIGWVGLVLGVGVVVMGGGAMVRRWGGRWRQVLWREGDESPEWMVRWVGWWARFRGFEWVLSLGIAGVGLGWPQWTWVGGGYGDHHAYGVVMVGIWLTIYVMAVEWDQSEKWALPMMVTTLFGVVSLGHWSLGWTHLLMALMVVMGAWLPWVVGKKKEWNRDGEGIDRPIQLLLLIVAIVGCRGTSQPLIESLFQTGLMIQYLFTIPGMVMGAFLAVYVAYYRMGIWQWVVVPLLPMLMGFVLGPDAGMMVWVSFGYMAPVMGILFSHTVVRMAGLSLLMSVVTYVGYPLSMLLLSSQSNDTRATVGIGFIVCWLMVILLSSQLRYEWTLDGVVRARMKRKRRHDV